MWGQGVYGAQILVLVNKFTFKVVLGVIFSHRLSLLLNIQIEKSDNFDPQFLKLVLPLCDTNKEMQVQERGRKKNTSMQRRTFDHGIPMSATKSELDVENMVITL